MTFNVGHDQIREEWLKGLKANPVVMQSSRIKAFLKAYELLRAAFPNERMVVASKWVHPLDLFDAALSQRHGITALRYDGTLSPEQRDMAKLHFENTPPEIPLFLTADAGGTWD
jgi:SNF2 family DNA or RNA helicase